MLEITSANSRLTPNTVRNLRSMLFPLYPFATTLLRGVNSSTLRNQAQPNSGRDGRSVGNRVSRLNPATRAICLSRRRAITLPETSDGARRDYQRGEYSATAGRPQRRLRYFLNSE